MEDGEQLLSTAYAMDAAIDEIVFILGLDSGGLYWPPPCIRYPNCSLPTVACGIGGTIFFSLKST